MTDEKKKLTKEQALAAMIDDFTMEHHANEAKGMTEEELMADLAEQGLPEERVRALFAKQDAMIKAADEADAKKPPVAPPKTADVIPFLTKVKFTIAGAAITAVLGGAAEGAYVGATMLAHNPSGTVPSADTATAAGTGTGAPPNAGDNARTLRDQAYTECGKTHWQRCLELLDEAKNLDIDGDSDPQVKATRALVSQMLAKDGG